MRNALVAFAALLLMASCYKEDNYCAAGQCPGDTCTVSAGSCVCLLPAGTCVECTTADTHNCPSDKPICSSDNTCVAPPAFCKANSDCPASGACLENGACADAANVIYTSPTGVNTADCGRMAGVNECSLTQAALEVQGARNIIRLANGIYGVGGLAGQDFPNDTVLVARGATISRIGAGNGAILNVNGKTLTLIGGTVTGAIGDDGVQCSNNGALRIHEATIRDNAKSGIDTDSCAITVSRSILTGNLRGGLVMSLSGTAAPVTITNNFIHNNGLPATSTVGGMALFITGTSKVEFNTVVDNLAMQAANLGGGIRCNSVGTYDFPNNLIYGNNGGIGNQVQVIGDCTFGGSFVMEDTTGADNAPKFKDPTANPPDYHLTPQTPTSIRDAVTCSRLIDFDGDERPAPTGGKCDLGADELKP